MCIRINMWAHICVYTVYIYIYIYKCVLCKYNSISDDSFRVVIKVLTTRSL